MKRTICIAIAAMMLLLAVGCSGKTNNTNTDPSAAPIYTAEPGLPSKQTGTNTSSIGLQQASERLGYKAGTIIVSFIGKVKKDISIDDMMALEFYSFNEGGDDTPQFSGPLVKDVLELAGAADAATITIRFGNADPLVLNVSDLDMESCIFALKKDDKVFGLVSKEMAYLIYHLKDGSHSSPVAIKHAIELG